MQTAHAVASAVVRGKPIFQVDGAAAQAAPVVRFLARAAGALSRRLSRAHRRGSDENPLLHPFAKLAGQCPSLRAIAFARARLHCFPWSDKSPSPSTRFPRVVF
jgi:hypothetical protein